MCRCEQLLTDAVEQGLRYRCSNCGRTTRVGETECRHCASEETAQAKQRLEVEAKKEKSVEEREEAKKLLKQTQVAAAPKKELEKEKQVRKQRLKAERDAEELREAGETGDAIEECADSLVEFLTPPPRKLKVTEAPNSSVVPTGPCSQCRRDKTFPRCEKFAASPFKKSNCQECSHSASEHQETTQVSGETLRKIPSVLKAVEKEKRASAQLAATVMNPKWNSHPRSAIEAMSANEPLFISCNLAKNTMFAMKHREYCIQLGPALANNSYLTTLSLSGCDLVSQDALIIADALKTNHTLRKLDLSNNKISNDGATSLSHGLRLNHTLTELNLLGNGAEFGEPCLQSYIDLFAFNVSLLKIIWRLNSRKSFTINKLLVRNNSIRKWLREGKSVVDFWPDSANIEKGRLLSVLEKVDEKEVNQLKANVKSTFGICPADATYAQKKTFEEFSNLWGSYRALKMPLKQQDLATAESLLAHFNGMRTKLESLAADPQFSKLIDSWRMMNKDLPAAINSVFASHNASSPQADDCSKCGVSMQGKLAAGVVPGKSLCPKCFVCTSCNKKLSPKLKTVLVDGNAFCDQCARVAFAKSPKK